MGFGSASPAEAAAKLAALTVAAEEAEAAGPQPASGARTLEALAAQVLGASSLVEAQGYARAVGTTSTGVASAPREEDPFGYEADETGADRAPGGGGLSLESGGAAVPEAVVGVPKGGLHKAFRDRSHDKWPETVELYLGPTNSGKTFRALDFLAAQGSGCYAGPLRALAWEVRQSMELRVSDKWGRIAPGVGLWTGEECENASASILCCTAEVAPASGEVLVLDEVHWCVDGWRGHAWTRLLLAAKSGRYKHVRVCGPVEALPLLRSVFDGCADDPERFKVHRTVRRSRLRFDGEVSDLRAFLKERVREKRFVAVVAFSRSAVVSLAGAAQAAGARASVIYGKLPPEARRSQLEAAIRGDLDVIVCTDVIGHGINLPLDDVVFAETRKFDGQTKRDLETWEAAQVAGRAGRGDTEGHCWYLSKYGAKKRLVENAVAMANGDPLDDDGGLRVDKAVISPDLGALRDLCNGGEVSVLVLPAALRQWRDELQKSLLDDAAEDTDWPKWVRGGDYNDLIDRFKFLQAPTLVPLDVRAALTVEDLWHLARLPIKNDRFEEVATAACLGTCVRRPSQLDQLAGEALEDEVQRLGDIIVSARIFPVIIRHDPSDESQDDDNLAAAEALYLAGSKLVGGNVQANIETAFLCVSCGRAKSVNAKPSDAHCRPCFLNIQREKQRDAAGLTYGTPNATPGRTRPTPHARGQPVPLTPNRHAAGASAQRAHQTPAPPPPPPHRGGGAPMGTPIVIDPMARTPTYGRVPSLEDIERMQRAHAPPPQILQPHFAPNAQGGDHPKRSRNRGGANRNPPNRAPGGAAAGRARGGGKPNPNHAQGGRGRGSQQRNLPGQFF